MSKRYLVVVCVMLIAAVDSLVAAPQHPLDHLTAAEHWAAYDILQKSDRTDSEMVIAYVGLHEPPKSEVLAWREGDTFRREVLVHLVQNEAGYEAVLDLQAGTMLDWRDTPGQNYMRLSGEDETITKLLLEHDDIKAAFERRGVADRKHVFCWGINEGYFDQPEERGNRVVRAVCGNGRGRFRAFGSRYEGLVVVPHTNLAGELVSLYARSTASSAHKERRHDHLKGVKGYFNAQALTGSQDGPVWVVEGAFDALALLEAGVERVVAVFGVGGWRWSWFRQVAELVFAFDADQAGTDAWRKLAKGAVMRGKRVETLTISAYGGEKDVAAAWAAGVLEVGSSPAMSSGGHSNEEAHREAYDERAAIMEYEAGLSREEAEEAARRAYVNVPDPPEAHPWEKK